MGNSNWIDAKANSWCTAAPQSQPRTNAMVNSFTLHPNTLTTSLGVELDPCLSPKETIWKFCQLYFQNKSPIWSFLITPMANTLSSAIIRVELQPEPLTHPSLPLFVTPREAFQKHKFDHAQRLPVTRRMKPLTKPLALQPLPPGAPWVSTVT